MARCWFKDGPRSRSFVGRNTLVPAWTYRPPTGYSAGAVGIAADNDTVVAQRGLSSALGYAPFRQGRRGAAVDLPALERHRKTTGLPIERSTECRRSLDCGGLVGCKT